MNHYATSMFFDKGGRHFWFARNLQKLGHTVTIFCATTILNKTETVDTSGKKWTCKSVDDIPFVFVKTSPTIGNGIDRIKNMIDFYFGLFPATRAMAKKSIKPDIVIASSVHPLTMVAGIQIAKRMKVPCICEIRDLWPEAIFMFGKAKEKSILGRILICGEHWIYRKADALIFTKEGDTDYLKEKGWTKQQGGDIDLTKCHYINNGIDIDAFSEQIYSEKFEDTQLDDSKAFNVVYTGTIRPVNNVGNLLDCAKIINKRKGYENVNFLIYGAGSELEILQKRVLDEGIEHVYLKGRVEKRYIPYILSKSAINVLNYSQNEYNWSRGNSSNKLFEYMASGKPIISTVKMGYSIINRYSCGIELEKCTPECLAEAIMQFHDMDVTKYNQFAINARNGAADFDFKVLTQKIMKVIESVSKC